MNDADKQLAARVMSAALALTPLQAAQMLMELAECRAALKRIAKVLDEDTASGVYSPGKSVLVAQVRQAMTL